MTLTSPMTQTAQILPRLNLPVLLRQTLHDITMIRRMKNLKLGLIILEELKRENIQLYKQYPDVFDKVAHSILKWRRRYHGNIPLCNRIFKKERVFKEAMESVPVIRAVNGLPNKMLPSLICVRGSYE